MHTVAVLALDDVVPFDLAVPCEVFGRAAALGRDGPPVYRVLVCGESPTVRSQHLDVKVRHGLSALRRAQTVIVPGIAIEARISEKVVTALRACAQRGTRIASICTGAFVLAAAGLLDGRRATTHWLAAPDLAARFPQIGVDPNVLFVDEGQILTSAGAAAGLDLCLHLIRRDLGAAAAAQAAKLAVMPLEREGGQAQFITHPPPVSSASLAPLLRWLEGNLHRPIRVDDMARKAAMSFRTFNRRFREQTGTTPLQWLLTARVRRAQSLLESSRLAIEQVATRTGFESAASFRDRFQRIVGISPRAYRRSFVRGAPATRPVAR
jgi:transcriptional regulator GlxA family with amidase domain